MSEALRLADMVEGVRAPYCGAAAAELRRLAAVEQELEALKRAISDAEPVRWVVESDLCNPCCAAFDHQGIDYIPLYTLKGIK